MNFWWILPPMSLGTNLFKVMQFCKPQTKPFQRNSVKIKFYFAKMVIFGHYFYFKIKLLSCSFLSHLGEVKTIFYLTPIYWSSVSINVFFCGITSHQLYFLPLCKNYSEERQLCLDRFNKISYSQQKNYLCISPFL